MRQENYNFFQEFNRVDKLCRDLMKAEQQGVTAYLNCMEENWLAGCRRVQGWKRDFENLKKLRHMRNHLAHDPDAFEEPLADMQDVRWLQEFQTRILGQTDPLALLYKEKRKAHQQRAMGQRRERQADAGLKDGCMGTGRSFWRLVATAAVMTAAAMAVMMLLIWLLLG